MSERHPAPDAEPSQAPDDLDEKIRARFEMLLEDYSQADIARRTGWTRSNVNRYVHGAKIPGEFLSALCIYVNVNPSWLLTGNGERYLTDIGGGQQTDAYEILRLINALNAVDKLRVGQVASKVHLKVLKDLRETMRRHIEVKKNLRQKLRPVFEKLVDDLRSALERSKLDRATNLRESALQIATFIEDNRLLVEFDQHQATLEFALRRSTEAVEFQRRSFVRALLAKKPMIAEASLAAHNLVVSLISSGLYGDANKICQATRALMPDRAMGLEPFQRLLVLHADILMERGALNEGIACIQSVLATPASQGTREFAQDYASKGMVLNGSLTFEGIAPQAGCSDSRAAMALLYASWSEAPDHIGSAYSRFVKNGREDSGILEAFVSLHVRALNGAGTGNDQVLTEFRRDADRYVKYRPNREELLSLSAYIAEAQLTRMLGKNDDALRAVLKAHELLNNLSQNFAPPLLMRAIHHRNVLQLVSGNGSNTSHAKALQDATAFFDEYRNKGYHVLSIHDSANTSPKTQARGVMTTPRLP